MISKIRELVGKMKAKLVIVSTFLLVIIILGGCDSNNVDITNNSGVESKNINQDNSSMNTVSEDNIQYKYNYDLDDIKDKKQFEKATDSINNYSESVKIRDIVHKVNFVEYYYTTDHLIENYYQPALKTKIENGKITSDEVLVMVNIDYTNNSNKSVEYYLNSFFIIGITSDNPWTWLRDEAYYQDKVLFPEKYNKSYFRIFIEPNSTHNGTIGFFIDKNILKTKNIYLQMSEDGSAEHNNYIKLPPIAEWKMEGK